MKSSLTALFVAAGLLGSAMTFAATPAPAASPAPAAVVAPAATPAVVAPAAAPVAAAVTTPAKKIVKKHASAKAKKEAAKAPVAM
jgi:hypothetical protein